MKILVIGHPLVVSANRKIWNEVAAHDGVEVDMIVPETWKSNLIKNLIYSFDEETDESINKIYPIACFRKGSGSFYFFNPIKTFNILRQKKYDRIVLTQETWALSLLELILLKLLSINSKTKTFIWVCQNIKKEKLFFLRFFERFTTSNLESILCCCSEIKEVITWKGIKTKCQYFPFSFDGNQYPTDLKVIKPCSPDIMTLGYLGRISEEKGINLIIQALDVFKEKNIKVKLVVAGAGPMEQILSSRDEVEYLGTIPHNEAYKFYEQIDIFVLPSQTRPFWKEQFGRVIIESVASGKPIVGSSSGAIPEVMGNISMPYIFQEKSLESLIQQTLQAWEDIQSGQINEIMKKSKERTFELYSHESVAKRFLRYTNENCIEGILS